MMEERLKELRKVLRLNQEKFGEKIGVSGSAVCNYENGSRTLMEQTIKSICREFNVDYLWLTEGIGEMFTNVPETILDELAFQYNLSDDEKKLVHDFVELDKDQRQVLMNFLRK
jgi:transcriptional regulator with XRE-family HTH domain